MTLIYKQDRMPGIVLSIFQELGWEEHDEKIHNDEEWNVHWKPTRYVVPISSLLIQSLKFSYFNSTVVGQPWVNTIRENHIRN